MEDIFNRIAEIVKPVDNKDFYCPECKGKSFDVDYCVNPDCPNQPCCGKSKELCDCNK